MNESVEQTQSQPQSSKKGANTLLIVLLIIVIGILIGGGVYYLMDKKNVENTDTYQAVFLQNGQVYFGKMDKQKDGVHLMDVYYLQANQQLQSAGEEGEAAAEKQQAQPELSLVKLGNELHGPEDEMVINKEHILFYENLKSDSGVVEAIKQEKNK
ncbi:hypothetical protein KKH43_02695 [Patescibacteria group bacterium]|nr:hypothetical protein [Patescibacteria group bacterium]